jgi:PAS domain S-box-containing protein
MATILVVDDRQTNREFLSTLLGYQNHRVVEAVDGADALSLALAERPDLVITDILMPTMDGYEFVRRLRADPDTAAIPVIFHTAHYLDREARALARASGVSHIVYKPTEPQALLLAVDAALGRENDGAPAVAEEELWRPQTSPDDDVNYVNERLAALIDLGQQLAAATEPLTMLELFCKSARSIVGAKYAAVAVLDEDRKLIRSFLTSGMSPGVADSVPTTLGLIGQLLGEGGTARVRDLREHPVDLGLPPGHPEVSSFLCTAIETAAGVLGVFYLADKIGFDGFTREDERVVTMLGGQVRVALENAKQFAEIREQTAQLTQEIAWREVAQSALRASEERFSKAFSASPIPMSIVSLSEGRYIYVNETFLENSGFAREEVIGRTTEEVGIYAYPEEREMLRALLDEQGAIRNAEVHRRIKSGEMRVALTSSEMIEIDGIQCVLTANNDITERKRAEEAQQSIQQQLASIIDSAMDAIITVDASQKVVLFNAAAERIFGCPSADAIGQSLDRFIPERFRGAHTEHIRNFGRTAVTTRSMGSQRAIAGLRSSTDEFPIEASISQVQVDGQWLYTVIIRDITARKKTEEELAKKAAELQQQARLLDLAQVLVREPNDNKIILWNRGAEEFYGWTRDEALGKSPHDLFHTEFPSSAAEIQAQILGEGHWEGELTQTRRDGTRVTVASHQVLHRNERGEPVAILEANNDITARMIAERKLAEHALRLSTSEETLRARNEELQTMSGQLWHAAKLATVGELAASVAHEINNPLATVSLRVDSLLSELDPHDPRHRSLTIVAGEVERISNLVASLLQFSRRAETQVSTIDLRDEVLGTLELLRNHLRNRNIDVVMEFAPDVPKVLADRQQLRQVFLNVLTNAADAMPSGGTLTIRGIQCNLDREPRAMRIEFADTGVGITHQDLSRVTEPFFTTKPEGKGTGLGLPICKRIAQEHGGTFEITSEPGKGTTVIITIPVSAPQDDSELGTGLP